MFRVEEKRQKLIEDFFKEETKWQAEHVGYMMVACLMIGITGILWLIPYQNWDLRSDGKILIMMYVMEQTGIQWYLQKYTNYNETGKVKRVDELMKYLPVAYRELCVFKLRKLKKLYLYLTGITLFGQIVFTLAFYHTLGVMNLLFPVLTQFMIPLAFHTGMMFFRK